jgi:hypothetical protein
MATIWRSRITIIWAILVAATFLSFETMALGNAFLLRSLILVIAFGKVTLVGREFMELRHAPPLLLWLFQGWAALTCAALIILFHG